MNYVHLSLHGLIRAQNPELGCNPDTGGQIQYVLDLARALCHSPRVERVELLTRRIRDPRIAQDYGLPCESLIGTRGANARIVRLSCGPDAYVRKEELWPYLEEYAERMLRYFHDKRYVPDVIHSHYADAGWVATRVCEQLDCKHVHTGHSLGRLKYVTLRHRGVADSEIERRYKISQRIAAEEEVLASAQLIVASTEHEAVNQYSIYENYDSSRIAVIPPGVDQTRFHPYSDEATIPEHLQKNIARFLQDPNKPMILTLARADERKNTEMLVHAFGRSQLREKYNLVLFVGQRTDIALMGENERTVLTNLLMLIDKYDLYGVVAYPKAHTMNDVPEMYRLAAKTRGLFANIALVEPFGLTLIEAASVGLPVLATQNGGARDIVSNCQNGLLVDPLDSDSVRQGISTILEDPKCWNRWSRNGIDGVRRRYSWERNSAKLLESVRC